MVRPLKTQIKLADILNKLSVSYPTFKKENFLLYRNIQLNTNNRKINSFFKPQSTIQQPKLFVNIQYQNVIVRLLLINNHAAQLKKW